MMHMAECQRRVQLLLQAGLPEGMHCTPQEITLLPGRGQEPLLFSPAPILLCRPGLTNSRKTAAAWARQLTYTTDSVTARQLPTGQLEISLGDKLLYSLWNDSTTPELPKGLSVRKEEDSLFALPFFYARLRSLRENREDSPPALPLEKPLRLLLWQLLRGEALLSASPHLAAGWLQNAQTAAEAYLTDRQAICRKTLGLLMELLVLGDKKHPI